MRYREVIIGDRIFLEIVVEAPVRTPAEEDEDAPRGRARIGELVPDAYDM